jgi:putative addiction module component (TIGR02574 family)
MSNLQELLQQALALTPEERLEMYHALLDSLDGEEAIDPETWETLWAEEIERRRSALAAGETRLIPGEDAFREAFERLQREPQS